MSLKKLSSKVKQSNFAAKAYVQLQRHRQPSSSKCVIFFPDEVHTGTAGDLRAVAIARELQTMGWRTIVVPQWLDLTERRTIVCREPSAILFFQQSRHALNKPALFPFSRSVFDADDADILLRPEEVIECLKTSDAAIAGSEFLAQEFRRFNPNVTVVWTGTYLNEIPRPVADEGLPIIVWAQSYPFDLPLEADLVLQLWKALASEGVKFRAAVYCNDANRVDEWLAPLKEFGIEVLRRPVMRYEDFVHSLSGAAIGLQPICMDFPRSRGKSFGKVLAYITADVPVIASKVLDHPLFFRNEENGLLVNTFAEWVEACKILLADPDKRAHLAQQAHKDLLKRLTTREAAERVARVLEQVLAQPIHKTAPPGFNDDIAAA